MGQKVAYNPRRRHPRRTGPAPLVSREGSHEARPPRARRPGNRPHHPPYDHKCENGSLRRTAASSPSTTPPPWPLNSRAISRRSTVNWVQGSSGLLDPVIGSYLIWSAGPELQDRLGAGVRAGAAAVIIAVCLSDAESLGCDFRGLPGWAAPEPTFLGMPGESTLPSVVRISNAGPATTPV